MTKGFGPVVALLLVSVSLQSLQGDDRGSQRDADQLKQKVTAITSFAGRPAPKSLRTPITEREVNAYFAFEAQSQIPMGVVEPSVAILGTGRLSGKAVVDLDAVRKAKNPTSLLDPTYYLTGRLPVTASGVLTTSNGMGRFQLESTTVGGVPIPKLLLQEIVSYYSRTPTNPRGIVIDDPFALPAGIREIQVEQGQAIIIQ